VRLSPPFIGYHRHTGGEVGFMLMEQKPFLQRFLPSGEQAYPVQCQGWLLVAARAARLVVHLDTA